MYRRLICLLAILSLTGCAYYGDLHGTAEPISISELNTHHVYSKKSSNVSIHNHSIHNVSIDWWESFHDPQLQQLIISALADSPNMQIAEARVRRAQAMANAAVVPLWTAIDFSGYVQREKFSEFGLVPPPFNGHTFNIGELGFNLTYDFDFWGKNRETLAAKISEKCAAQADLAEARLILSASVASMYFQLLRNQALLSVAKENATLTQEISNIVLERSRRGIESDIPVKTAMANAQSAQLSIQQYKQAEQLAKNQLAIFLGKNPFTTAINTSHFSYDKQSVSLPAHLTINLLAQRPDIYATKLRAEAAAHEINSVKASFFPDINLMALFSYQSVGLGHLFDVVSQNNGVTGAVNLPIFDAGLRRANLSAKYAEYDLAVNNYNQTLLTALREVADQLAILKSVRAQIQVQEKAIKATAHNYSLFQTRYRHGIIDYVQVLEIKQLLLQYRSIQLDLQTRHLQAVVGMLKALGGNEMSTQGSP